MTTPTTPSAVRANTGASGRLAERESDAPTKEASLAQRLVHDKHVAMIGLGATLLTGAVLYFNGSYGASISAGMCIAFIGAAISKDACIAYAWSSKGRAGRIAAGGVGALAFLISALAAIGAASHGRQEASDPKAEQISRYESAARTRAKADERLAQLGKSVPTPADAEAAAARALANVNAGISKRTKGCTVLAPDGQGQRQIEANRAECQPVIDAKALAAKAEEAADLRAKIDAAEAILAEGKPATADAQASTLAAFFGLFTALNGIEGIQAWTNLAVGLGLEIMSSLSWAAFAAAFTGGANRPSIGGASDAHPHPRQASLPPSAGLAPNGTANGGTSPSFAAAEFDNAAMEALAAVRERFFANGSAPAVAGASVPTADVIAFPNRSVGDFEGPNGSPNGSPDGSGGPKGGQRVRRTDRKAEVLADIRARDARGERFASQEDLRAVLVERFGPLAKSTLSNWLDELEQSGSAPQRQTIGRCKAVG